MSATALYLEIGVAPVGSANPPPLFSANLLPLDYAPTNRDRLISEVGILGVAKRGGAIAQGINYASIRVFQSDSVQFWWRFDGGSGSLIESNMMNQSPYGLMVKDNGSNGIAAMGIVSAVSTYGLVVLALVVLVGGSLVIRKRAAVR